ncbi:MAG: aryl-sulfate sulfotransferase, partial [Thermodesulfobacteriota bacterium]
NYDENPKLRSLGWIIGQHHAHMIPRGLPGEGNLLIFDNGGWAGYGSPNPGSPTGFRNALRDHSRVLEINPVSLDIVWQYTPAEAGLTLPVDANRFYSPFISSAQRLPNGNTLITEGSGGRLIEVTSDHAIVWEYISPFCGKMMKINMIYRAYRVPYAWVPQAPEPLESPIEPIDVSSFRVPGAAAPGPKRVVSVEGVLPYRQDAALCVLTDRKK